MAEQLDPKEIVTLEELAISSMWEMAALVEVLEKKGLLTKQDILDAIQELRRKNPQARTPVEFDDHPPPPSLNPTCSRKRRMPSYDAKARMTDVFILPH